jgi:hypothetical protein
MSFRFVNKIISDLVKIEPPLLGRWRLDTTKSTKLKIDMGNIDHCGTCNFKVLGKKIEEATKEHNHYKISSPKS